MGGALRFMSTAPEQAEIKPSPKSVVSHPYALDERPLDAKKPSNPEDRFAVVSLSGTQFKVTVGDTIVADHMEGLDIGDRVVYPEVLLVGSRRATVVGRPLVEKAEVHCSVEELTRDKKVITFKSRRRKNSRRLRGFRRRVTILRVDSIKVSTADHELL
jgi:large subunit ribosomal protein L21